MRRVMILVTGVALAALMAVPALAISGTVSCGSGGHGYTHDTSGGWRTHRFGASEATVTGPTMVYHGWHTGSVGWSISGSGSGTAYCPA